MNEVSGRPFRLTMPVRFADIDHAGIVYYPRIIDVYHLAFEEFFGECVGTHYGRVLDEWKLGFPAVKAEVESPMASDWQMAWMRESSA